MMKSDSNIIKLRCHGVLFYSSADEASFFYFIKQVRSVCLVQGIGEDIFLHIKTPVPIKALRDLMGLFRRYNISMDELKSLKNKKNDKVFRALTKHSQ